MKNLYTSTNVVVDKENTFFHLFEWLIEERIFPSSSKEWVIDDFRKLSTNLACSLVRKSSQPVHKARQTTILKFLDVCVDKFGAKKLRDFMET